MQWRRLRTVAKWTGAVATAFVALALLAAVLLVARVDKDVWSGQVVSSRGVLMSRGAVAVRNGTINFAGIPGAPQSGWKCEAAWRPSPVQWVPEDRLYGSAQGMTEEFWVPLWIPFLLVAVPTALVWRADYTAARRARSGLCATCGYDRRALAADAKCPECGTVPTPAVPTK
jgi:hypothetical protein